MAAARRDEASNPGDINAVLGRGSAFEGKLHFEGTVRIEGRFSGEILTPDTLVIGEGADVTAEIHAGTVIVSGGTVTGTIRAKTVIELERNARVKASIETPALKVERGVIFAGTCKMENLDEPADAPTPPVALHEK
ncbi:MAG TPA: polymer-forming cytoskeletal protein [Vulgatibacter sp.]|nr:polymer-forming cytoskeletal protein [Vulgatibacter sp.]